MTDQKFVRSVSDDGKVEYAGNLSDGEVRAVMIHLFNAGLMDILSDEDTEYTTKVVAKLAELKAFAAMFDHLMVGDLEIKGLSESGDLIFNAGEGFPRRVLDGCFGKDTYKYKQAARRP